MFLGAYRELKPEAPAPTLTQFRYYYATRYTQAQKSKGQSSDIAWAKDRRPLEGTAKSITLGIGDCYEIDSTQADQALVSEFDSSIVVGRPTLWSVVDRASGMIVGIHVTLDPPSLQGALDALYVAFSPKKDYCAKFGIEIEEQDWPASGLPRVVVSDNAELLSDKTAAVARSLGIWFENAASYRADSKGTVESSLGALQALARPILPKTINEIRLKKAGGGDSRLSAKLTLRDYTAIMILMVLARNKHVLETTPVGYPTDRDASPIACWNWALETPEACCLRSLNCSAETLRIALLVRQKATVSEDGICCDGFFYDCAAARNLGWFDRGKSVKRPADIEAAINPDDVSTAWLFTNPKTEPMKAERCELGKRSIEFAGMPLFEARKKREARAASRRRTARSAEEEAAKRLQAAQKIVKNAEKPAIKSPKSKAQQLREIGENKELDRIMQSKAHPRVEAAKEPADDTAAAAEPQQRTKSPLEAFLAMDN